VVLHGTCIVSITGALPEALGGEKLKIVPAGKNTPPAGSGATTRFAVPNCAIVTDCGAEN
jgi:hypothetical protein